MATRYGQIVNQTVHWIFADASLYARYQETATDLGLTFLELADDAVQEGWIYDGAVFSAPPTPAPAPLLPAALEPVDFLKHLMTHGGVTLDQIGAAKGDANLSGAWVFFDAVRGGVHKDDPITQQLLGLLRSLSYLASDQALQAVNDAWPTT